MRVVAAGLLLLSIEGCTHVQVGATSTASAGTVASSSAASVQVNAGGPLAVVILGAMIAAAADDGRNTGPYPPPMDPKRAVSEQDCTKPIELTGNLRCR